MSRGRSAAVAAALIALISLLGACSSGNSSEKTLAADKRSAAANKAAAAQNRALVARRRATARARRLETPTTPKRTAPTTPTPKVVTRAVTRVVTTPTTIVTQASTTPSDDLSAIESTVDALNSAFHSSVSSGITNSTTANYWVGDGSYTGDQCVSFESARGQGIVAENIVVHTDSLVSAPGWVDPVIGKVPQGRIYQLAIDEIQTLVTTGQQRARTFPIHVTVQPDGHARLFLRCS